jgi:sugar phosphate permease
VTETRAIILIFLAMLLVLTAVCLVLGAMNASGTAYAVAMVLVGGVAADASSQVVMHYGPSRRRRRQ